MAEIVPFDEEKTFHLHLSDEDYMQIINICAQKKTGTYNVILAYFHAGLVSMSTHCQKCLQSGDQDA